MENDWENLRESLNSQQYCEICFNPAYEGNFTCPHHYFCTHCIRAYIEIKILEGQVLSITCPYTNCKIPLTSEYISLNSSESLYNKYQELFNNKQKEQNIYFRWCPQRNCSGSDTRTDTNKLKCNLCQYEFCFMCANKWHDNSKCSEFMETGFLQWGKENKIKRCPVCLCVTQKNGGCPQMVCTKCGCNWCWYCSKKLANHDFMECFKQSQGFNFFWYCILSLMFFPVLFFFFFFALCLVIIIFQQQIRMENGNMKFIEHIIRFRYIYLVTSFFVSPVIMGFIISISPVIVGVIVPFVWYTERGSSFNIKTIFAHLLFFLMIPVFGVIMNIVYGIAFVVFPIIGISLAFYKLFGKRNNDTLSGIIE